MRRSPQFLRVLRVQRSAVEPKLCAAANASVSQDASA